MKKKQTEPVRFRGKPLSGKKSTVGRTDLGSRDQRVAKRAAIVVWGGGGHGHVVIDLLRVLGGWDIAGVIDNLNPKGAVIMGVPVLGDADMLPALRNQGVENIVVAIGDCAARARMLKQALALGFRAPTLIHPSCILSPSARIGSACVLCAGSIVGAQTKIGDRVILNTRASVDHDNQIGDGTHVAPGAVVCGFVSVGRESWIGAGAVVRDHLSIGRRVMVGAGSLVLKDVPDGQTVYGKPAICQGKEQRQ
jgi:sugar O-acyltransferase (sialic acid O-acetyltransferase NeuD family)